MIQQTSIESFSHGVKYGCFDEQSALVAAVLLNLGSASNRMIAFELNKHWAASDSPKRIEPSTVSARVNELRQCGDVVESFRGHCHVTAKKVIFWRLR